MTNSKITLTCDLCGKKFERFPSQIRPTGKRYCSRACAAATLPQKNVRTVTLACEQCGKTYQTKPNVIRNQGSRFCSKRCYWDHRTATSKSPYLAKKLPDGKRKTIHRLVMEAHLGRKLEHHEHVHHIDGDKRNNNIGNLEVLDKTLHRRLRHSARATPAR